MELQIIGSGSSGNCYCLTSSTGQKLLLEAGISFKETVKALDYQIKNVVGCLLSHEHMADHAKSVEDFLKRGIDVYCSKGTADNIKYKRNLRPTVITVSRTLYLGEFTILPFNVDHDAAEPFGYAIAHKECGNIIFATDTKNINYKFVDIYNWIIEANYSEELMIEEIKEDRLNGFLANRIHENHMSLETCIEVLKNGLGAIANTITLIHLSSANAWGEQFQDQVSRAIGVRPHIAKKGLIVKLF